MLRTPGGAYRAEMTEETVRARAIRLFLAGDSPCEIAAVLRRTTTPGSIRTHLRAAGLGGVVWCPLCHVHDQL